MLESMRRLHPRGAAKRGVCVDAEGATLGPDCTLVCRGSGGYRALDRDTASDLQKCVLDFDRDRDWLFQQCRRIAAALNKGEVALAQIYGLHIPIGDLDDPANGVFLPEAQNDRLHTSAYYDAVNRELAAARTRVEAEQILRSIARRLSEGSFPCASLTGNR